METSLDKVSKMDAALSDATNMVEVVSGWMDRALEFEKAGELTLSPEELKSVLGLDQLTLLISEVDRIFHSEDRDAQASLLSILYCRWRIWRARRLLDRGYRLADRAARLCPETRG